MHSGNRLRCFVLAVLIAAGLSAAFVGEVNETQKQVFLGNARGLLFPIDWPEPFGLVMIEAMACGTPVLAFNEGSVSEVIDDGVTGVIVNDVDEAIAACPELLSLDRREIRRTFDRRFSASRMARDYVSLYRSLIAKAANGKSRMQGAGAVPESRTVLNRQG